MHWAWDPVVDESTNHSFEETSLWCRVSFCALSWYIAALLGWYIAGLRLLDD